MPKIRTESLRINSTLFRKVVARAKAEDHTLVDYVEAALREKLERSPVTVIVHPKLRKPIRRSKLIPTLDCGGPNAGNMKNCSIGCSTLLACRGERPSERASDRCLVGARGARPPIH